jgi:hypothetical protein
VSVGIKAAVKNLELNYKCLRKEADKVKQDRAVFSRQKVLTDIFRR